MSTEEGIRLQKVLAQAGVASRRAAEDLIARRRVEVNGEVVREQGLRVDPARDVIR
ncbi:MAG: MFS transporter, partial [Actinobacteria bacterium]|nr:MFS transporter [Actinomycetota bacterium]